jgi:hypothetical protein
VAEITIIVEPIRLESGAWIQNISVKFPDGERNLNVATAYREGSAQQQSAELQALLVRLAEASQDEAAGKARKERDGSVVRTDALHPGIPSSRGNNCN